MKCTPWSYQSTNELYHYGIKHRSGRYPYGSGERPYQDMESQIHFSKNIGKQALTGALIGATGAGTYSRMDANIASTAPNSARNLRDQGYSFEEISQILGKDDRTIQKAREFDSMNGIKGKGSQATLNRIRDHDQKMTLVSDMISKLADKRLIDPDNLIKFRNGAIGTDQLSPYEIYMLKGPYRKAITREDNKRVYEALQTNIYR